MTFFAKDIDGKSLRRRVAKTCDPKTDRTKQEFAKECDVNRVLAHYEKTGLLAHVNKYQAQYGDFSDIHDYHGAMTAVVEAQAAFEGLPSKIRSRFANDPGAFLEFISDPANEDEARRIGLLPRLPAEAEAKPERPAPEAPAEPPPAAPAKAESEPAA